jgi:PIN domain nuclease of toxin-antitoxin system
VGSASVGAGEDARWLVDDPPAASWFAPALGLGWTRDPFDRLLAAHASLRGWRLATADEELLRRLGDATCLEL